MSGWVEIIGSRIVKLKSNNDRIVMTLRKIVKVGGKYVVKYFELSFPNRYTPEFKGERVLEFREEYK